MSTNGPKTGENLVVHSLNDQIINKRQKTVEHSAIYAGQTHEKEAAPSMIAGYSNESATYRVGVGQHDVKSKEISVGLTNQMEIVCFRTM